MGSIWWIFYFHIVKDLLADLIILGKLNVRISDGSSVDARFRRLLPYGSFLQDLANQSQTHLYKNQGMLKAAHMAN